jgi:hypothetical protein
MWRLFASIMRLVVDIVCCAEYLYASLLCVNVECVMFQCMIHFEGEFEAHQYIPMYTM